MYHQKQEALADNLPIEIYINKTENSITSKMRSGYYLEFLSPETV